jgi:DNA-binding NtrC family response regulator
MSVRVLVVDDEPSVRWSLAAFLDDFDFEVRSAESAEEALDTMGEEPCDVAIVDLRLPGMSGDTMILQAHRLFPEMRFLIHSGTQSYHLPEELRRIGMRPEHVFLKPQVDLMLIVEAVLSLTGES